MVGTPQWGRIQNLTIPITLVLLLQLFGETSGRMLDPNRSRRNGDLLSLMGDEEGLIGGEGEVGENEKIDFEKVEGEEIQDFEGGLFVL